MMFLYISYWAAGVLGLTVAIVSGILLITNLFDVVTDPIEGWLIDRTSGRFGKFRPFMVGGNILMAAGVLLIYATRLLPVGTIVLAAVFLLSYLVYIVGYSLQFNVTRSAQSILTNDPRQRPVYAGFDMVLNIILYVGISMLVSNYLVPKHGGFSADMFLELFSIIIGAAAVCTCLAVLAIRKKDRPQYFGLDLAAATETDADALGKAAAASPSAAIGATAPSAAPSATAPAPSASAPSAAPTPASRPPRIRLRDYLDLLLHNRSVAALMIAAGIDKLCSNLATNNPTVAVIIFGVICGDYALSGQMSAFVFLPSLLLSLGCILIARRIGQKRAFLLGTYGALLVTAGIFCLFVFGDPRSLSFTSWSFFTIALLTMTAVRGGFMSLNNSILVPMIADISDSEVARSGRYLPGMIGALLSFVDKLFTNLNNVVLGLLMIFVGFGQMYPTPDTALTPGLFWAGMLCLCGLPTLSWLVNLACMRFYPLDKARMAEISTTIARRRQQATSQASPRPTDDGSSAERTVA
jgi:Na+/melibiose symporter-like transporter